MNNRSQTGEGDSFLRGQDLALKVMASINGDPLAEYEARHRPRGVPQNVAPFVAALRQLAADESAMEGFAAVMTGTLSLGFDGFGLSLDDVRQLVRSDRVGGPGTVYSDEDGVEDSPSACEAEIHAASFMEGVHAFAEMINGIYGANDTNRTYIEAQNRLPDDVTDENCRPKQGVAVPRIAQYREPVVRLIQEVHDDTSMLEGFAAALVGFIGPTAHSSWGGNPGGYFKSLTYDQIEGVDETSAAERAKADPAFREFLRHLPLEHR